jgi:hypothetical protein
VVVSEPLGAPEGALAETFAPIAPAPLEVVSTPAKLMMVIDESTVCESVAVTVTLDSTAGAKALQISAVPNWSFVRCTNVHVKPAPLTAVTFAPEDNASLETNANNNSFVTAVENAGLVMVALATA